MKTSEIKKQLTNNSRLVINNGKEERVVELNMVLDAIKNITRRSLHIDESMAEDLANEMEQTSNSRFDRGKFLIAIEETLRDLSLISVVQGALSEKIQEHAKL
jgi:NADH:ubiquinone oxidoreductase subunit B-like Fe-S oxidoreductase